MRAEQRIDYEYDSKASERARAKIASREDTRGKQQIREVVKTTTLKQDPPYPKIDGVLCLHPPSSTSKDGVFFA